MSRKKLSIWKKITFSLLPLVFILVIFEIIARIYITHVPKRFQIQRSMFQVVDEDNAYHDIFFEEDPALFWVLKPDVPLNSSMAGFYRYFFSNSQRLRDDDVSMTKPENTFRILCLGDSCTFGVKIPYTQSYPEHLEKLLQQQLPDKHIEVINAGIPGYSSYQGRVYYQQFGLSYCPDMVIVCFGLNDRVLWNNMTDQEHARYFQRNSLLTWQPASILLLRKVVSWIRFDLFRNRENRPPKEGKKKKDVSLEEKRGLRKNALPRVPLEDFKDNYSTMILQAREHNQHIILMKWLIKNQSLKNQNDYQSSLDSIARDNRIPLVDLHSKTGEIDNNWWLDRFHLDGQGNLFVAKQLLPVILKERDKKRNTSIK